MTREIETDRVISLVEQDVARRLLSEQAVEAAAKAEIVALSSAATFDIVGYEEMMERQARETAVRILKAAIAATGLTTGGQGK